MSQKKDKVFVKYSRIIGLISTILISAGIILLILIFAPIVKEETKYNFHQAVRTIVKTPPKDLTPPNTNFSIVIPKIEAVAPIIANVDATDSKKYLPALKRGVAQAAGTKLPGQVGNVYLFAHSTDAFYNVAAYNAVFYLIGKLNSGDEIDIYYKGVKIKYEVYDKKVVSADSTQYLGTLISGEKTLTLQTCYPPGTTLKRLVVLAKQIN